MNLRNAALWSFCDQIVLSAVHFALGLLVLRSSSKAGYGAYVLCWSVLLLLTGLQNAFVNTQMTVRAAGLQREEQARTCGAFLIGQSISYAVLLLGALLIAAFAFSAFSTARSTAITIAVVALAFGGCALREFARSSLLLRGDARSVFRVDVAYAIVLIALVTASATLLPAEWFPHAAILALGLASAVAAYRCIHSTSVAAPSLRVGWREFSRTWNGGGWAAGGVLVTHIQSQSYVYLLGALAGLAVTAEANAARLLLMPVSLAFTSAQRVLYPHWVVLARSDQDAELSRAARRILVFTTVGILLYASAIVAGSDRVIPLLMGAAYTASNDYVWLFALLAWSEVVRSIASLQLQAHARFRAITMCNTVTAALVLTFSVLAIQHMGPRAAIAVQSAGDLLLAAMLLYFVRRDRVHDQATPARAIADSAASR